jgi:hypothetical protein
MNKVAAWLCHGVSHKLWWSSLSQAGVAENGQLGKLCLNRTKYQNLLVRIITAQSKIAVDLQEDM